MTSINGAGSLELEFSIRLTLSPICWVWVDGGIGLMEHPNPLGVDRGPCIYTMGNPDSQSNLRVSLVINSFMYPKEVVLPFKEGRQLHT